MLLCVKRLVEMFLCGGGLSDKPGAHRDSFSWTLVATQILVTFYYSIYTSAQTVTLEHLKNLGKL